jgi:acyl dehydratase
MKVFDSLQQVQAWVGQDELVGEWLTVTQTHINQFAQATGDEQWIHVDEARAKSGPFGAPIAHGFLTLSLLPQLCSTAFQIQGARLGVNYGLNRVRFTSPVPVNSRLRVRAVLKSCSAIEGGGVQLTWLSRIEREGSDKPVCIAETLTRWYE